MTQYSTYSNVIQRTTASYDAATVVLLARASVQPSSALATLIDTVIKGLKTDNVFSVGDTLWIRGVHESTLALQNWIKNANNTTLVGSPTFTAKVGFTCNGTSNYLNDNYIPNSDKVNLSFNGATLAFRISTLGAEAASYPCGCYSSSNGGRLHTYYTNAANDRGYLFQVTYNGNVNWASGDYITYTLDSSGNIQGYKNGVPSGAAVNVVPTAAYPLCRFFEGCYNSSNSDTLAPSGAVTNAVYGFLFIGGYLDATGVGNLYTRTKYFYDNVDGTF